MDPRVTHERSERNLISFKRCICIDFNTGPERKKGFRFLRCAVQIFTQLIKNQDGEESEIFFPTAEMLYFLRTFLRVNVAICIYITNSVYFGESSTGIRDTSTVKYKIYYNERCFQSEYRIRHALDFILIFHVFFLRNFRPKIAIEFDLLNC